MEASVFVATAKEDTKQSHTKWPTEARRICEIVLNGNLIAHPIQLELAPPPFSGHKKIAYKMAYKMRGKTNWRNRAQPDGTPDPAGTCTAPRHLLSHRNLHHLRTKHTQQPLHTTIYKYN